MAEEGLALRSRPTGARIAMIWWKAQVRSKRGETYMDKEGNTVIEGEPGEFPQKVGLALSMGISKEVRDGFWLKAEVQAWGEAYAPPGEDPRARMHGIIKEQVEGEVMRLFQETSRTVEEIENGGEVRKPRRKGRKAILPRRGSKR